jgi:hypothetical protein
VFFSAKARENYITQKNYAILGGKNNKQQKKPIIELSLLILMEHGKIRVVNACSAGSGENLRDLDG